MRSLLSLRFAVVLVLVSCDPVPEPQVWLRPLVNASTTIDRWHEDRSQIRETFRGYLGTAPATRPAPDVAVESASDLGVTKRLRITYQTEQDERAPAFVFLPKGETKPAGIVAFHQTVREGKDEAAGRLPGRDDYAYALELARQGYAVIAPDDAAAGERVATGEKPYDTARFYRKHPAWSALGKAVWDGQQAVDALCTFEAVDCTRLAAVGHSQGGIYAWLLAAFDERITVTVVNDGFGTFQGDPRPTRWARDSWWIGAPAMRPFLAARQFPFDLHEVLALIAPRALLLMGHREDEVFPHWHGLQSTEKSLRPVWALFGANGRLTVDISPGPHGFPKDRREKMQAFLRDHLRNEN